PRRRSRLAVPETYADLEALNDDEMIELAEAQDIKLDDRKPLLPQIAVALALKPPRRAARDEDEEEEAPRRSARGNGRDSSRPRPRSRPEPEEEEERPATRSRLRSPEPEEDDRTTAKGGRTREGDRVNRLRRGISGARD